MHGALLLINDNGFMFMFFQDFPLTFIKWAIGRYRGGLVHGRQKQEFLPDRHRVRMVTGVGKVCAVH